MSEMDFDFSEINKLSVDLAEGVITSGVKLRQAVEIAARNVKDAWAKKLEGTPDLPHGSRSIGYDLDATPGKDLSVLNAEIGAEDGKLQAPIVTVIEFGAPGKNLPPHGYGAAALQENESDFEKGLSLAAQPL